jgi:GDPmannose 4,6-dehydratase
MLTLITGALGQDGILLSRILQSKSENFIGICRPGTGDRYTTIVPGAQFIEVDLADVTQVKKMLSKIQPGRIVNFAAFTSVADAWKYPEKVIQINSILPAEILTWIAAHKPDTHFIHASSSEIFGPQSESPQSEDSRYDPQTLYGSSKLLSHNLTKQFRARYDLHSYNLILYNHESPFRKSNFVTQHVAEGVAKIYLGLSSTLQIGNLQSRRDWGWAPNYLQGVYDSFCSPVPEDYIFATGKTFSVEDLVKKSFETLGIPGWKSYIVVDEKALRKNDSNNLVGDSSKANKQLQWDASFDFEHMVKVMVSTAVKRLKTNGEYIWMNGDET